MQEIVQLGNLRKEIILYVIKCEELEVMSFEKLFMELMNLNSD